MRVVVITCWYPNRVNPGAGIFVERDVRALARDHEVRVVHLVAPDLHDGIIRTRTDSVPVLRVPMDPWNPLSVLRAAAQLRTLTGSAEILHTMAFPSAEPVRILPRGRQPWVHTEHFTGVVSVAEQGSFLRRAAARFVLGGPDLVTAVSSYLGNAITALGRPDAEVVPNIVETEGYIPPRRPDGALRLVAVGSLTEHKDPLLAVHVVAELARRGHDVHLTWYGEGPLRGATEAAASDLGVSDRVTLAGTVPPCEIAPAIGQSDALLHTSTIETFSLVAAEALAVGRPVIIQERGGHRDFAVPPWAALVGRRTPEAFADAVEHALESVSELDPQPHALGIKNQFSPEAFRERWNGIYRRLAQ